jgi:hypothetical protein
MVKVRELAKMLGIPSDRIVSLALQRGLEILYQQEKANRQEREAEQRSTAVHEAGHAVAYFMIAQELGHAPAEAVELIKVNPSASGYVQPAEGWHKNLTASQQIMIDVAGAVAEAKLLGKTFDELWKGGGCRFDRRNARRRTREHPDDITIEDAAKTITAKFGDPAVWTALRRLADQLTVGKTPGRTAWEHYSTALVQLPEAA